MKRKVLTLSEKGDIIKHLENGVSVTHLSTKYGVAKSTVCAIKKNKINILNLTTKHGGVIKRKTLKSGENPRMEKKLYEWFCKQRLRNLPVTSQLLKIKAKSLNEILKETVGFSASDGWLQKFKRRFGIRFLKISGEKLSKNPELVPPFQQNLRSIIDRLNLTNDQIYNADETGLFWKLLPEKTLVKYNEKTAPGRKGEKARLTFLACTNATGEHKVRPLVLGKAKNPRCFKNFTLPVDYDYSKNAWMTAAIFEKWFHKSFVLQVKKYLKQKNLPETAVLLLDNAPSHPPAENLRTDDGKIFVVYMPPNVTPLIQPMDQNVIRVTKLYYRSSLLSSVLSSTSEDLSKVLKALTIKDAILNLSLAWNRLDVDMIQKCWKNIFNLTKYDDDYDPEENIPLSILKDQYKNEELIRISKEVKNLLTEVNSQVQYLEEDIMKWNEDNSGEQNDSDDILNLDDDYEEESNEESSEKVEVSSSEAVDAFNKAIIWSEQNIFNIEDLLVLRKYITVDLEPQIAEKGGGGAPTNIVNSANDKHVYSKPPEDMSVCVETSTTALIQPVVSSLSTSTSFSEVVVSTPSSQTSTGTVSVNVDSSSSNEIKPDQHLAGKSIAKLVVTNQHGPTSSNPVLQKVVNSPLITVLNSTGPLTVVKSLCVTSVGSSAPHYTLVNSAAPLNVTNAVGKAPTITVLNCGSLASPVTVVKTITAQQAIEKSPSDIPSAVSSNVQSTTVSPAIIENRGHNVFVKNTCPDSTIPDNVPQSHKLLTATNFSPTNVLANITTAGKSTANGQRSKLKILSNVQIAGASQQNVMINKTPNLPQPRYNVTARQKIIGVNNAPAKYVGKSPNNVLKPAVNPTVKSPQDKPAKLIHPPMQKGPIKSLPPSSFMPKPQQGIKTLSPQHKNVPGQVQRTGSGLRTIPPQRPQKVATKPNYIGKHAVQAQKIKQSTHAKLRTLRPPSANMYGYHPPPMHEKQLTFNQALTAQIIETLSNTSTPPPSSRFEILPARYDSAFNCPDKQVPEPVKAEEKTKSGLDALSLICQAVLLDHNYNATLPSESPPRPTPPINTQAQVNGIPPTSIYSAIQNKRRVVPPPNTLLTSSHSNVSLCASNSASALGSHGSRDDDAASDISDTSDRKHDTEGEETDTAPEAEDVKNDDHYGDYVTRCICGFLHDDGYMVECDKCKVWQHVQCVVKNRQIPDEYLCEVCDPGKLVDRQKARLVQQQWIRERQLIEPKIRKEVKLKDTVRHNKDHSDSDSSDGERAVRNNNVVTKSRAASAAGRRKSESGKANKKEVKEPIQRRQKRKEKKIVKRKAKLQVKQQPSHSDDENQDTWSAHLPQLRQWIEKYEEAVTNHYSPELRARISSIRVNGAHVDSSVDYDATVCKCRIHTQPLTEIKYLVSTTQLAPNTPVIELRGKYMLSTQHRNSGGSLTTRQHTQRPGPFLFFYRLHKDNTEVCVDTRTYGNSARFIRRSCKPNAELRHCIEKGVLHLFIVSISTVEKNCELTIKHESHDLAAIGTTQIACACGRPDECSVNKTTIKKNGEVPEVTRKRRGRRTTSSSIPSPDIKSPVKEQPPTPIIESATVPLPPSPLPAPSVAEPEVKEFKEEKVEVIEPVEVKVEIKEEPIEPPEEKPKIKVPEIKEEKPEPVEDPKSPSPPIKVEVKKEKPPKEEKIKSPPLTPIATRRSSHHKSDKEDSSKETETKEQATKSKKLSREERKLEAILRAIEQMEKADQKKQEHQAKQAHRRESEPGPNPKEEEKPEPKVKRRRRRGRARTTSTSAQTRRSRLNSTDSYMTSGDENLLSPNDSNPSNKPSTKDGNSTDKAAGLLLALSNGESENNKDTKKSVTQDHDSSSNSAHSSPETPQLSSACLLVQAAVEPLESGFKFPKTKKGLMNEWLNKTPDSVHPASAISPSSLIPHLSQQISEDSSSSGTNGKNLTALAQAANLCDTPTQQRGGNAKKRWLRQAISEDHSCDSPAGRPDSPTISEAVAPPKKRKLPRESVSNDNSPPSTPTSSGPAKSIDTPRSSQEGSVEIISSGAEGDSPSHTLESDAELKERAAKMKQEFGKTVTLSTSEQVANNLSGLLDCRLPRESGLFSSSDHLVGTVEKTLSIFGFENNTKQSGVTTPAKRKVKLSITEYRQRKRINTDKTDDHDVENDSQGNDDNNSSESFKTETLPKSRSRSSSSSSSFSSSEELSSDVIIKAPAFNCEPTELERQREISSIRLKKAFGLNIDDESRKPPVIDMTSILNCDLESKIKPTTPLVNTTTFTSFCELSMSPTLRAPGTPDRAYTPILPPSTNVPLKSPSPTKEVEKDTSEQDMPVIAADPVEPMEVDKSEDKKDESEGEGENAEMKGTEENKEETNMFYTPDDDEDRATSTFEEPETVNYVPPFNNPVYPNSNFASFTSTIDDDSRYQSRNPSPPPELEAATFTAS